VGLSVTGAGVIVDGIGLDAVVGAGVDDDDDGVCSPSLPPGASMIGISSSLPPSPLLLLHISIVGSVSASLQTWF